MNWTAEKPTISGIYLHRKNETDRVSAVEVWYEGGYVFRVGTSTCELLADVDGQFLGPIHPQES